MPIPATPDPARIDTALAGAEAKLRFRASQIADLPGDARITRIAVPREQPPTLDIEYLAAGQRILLRQGPAQSTPDVPPEAQQMTGFPGKAMVRVDANGNENGAELYWTADGMDYALAGVLPIDDLVRIALSVRRPTA